MIALAQLLAPVGQLKRLVEEQHRTALLHKFAGKVYDAAALEIKVVEVNIQALSQSAVEIFLRILQQERRAPHASRAADANQAVTPVYRVHQRPAHGSVDVFKEERMCLVKWFHTFGI